MIVELGGSALGSVSILLGWYIRDITSWVELKVAISVEYYGITSIVTLSKPQLSSQPDTPTPHQT